MQPVPTRVVRPRAAFLAVLAVVALMVALPSVAAAREPTDPQSPEDAQRQQVRGELPTVALRVPGPGYDISYPQCGKPFPRPFSFAIVGVNGGRVYSANPCLGAGNGPSQLAWAGRYAQFYANTGNPGPEQSSYWPHGQTRPRECNTASTPGADTADCAYDYGWNAAADSYRIAVEAYISLGWARPGAARTPVANFWWLDVETANSWRADPRLNVAALQGAVDFLESMDVAGIGFYSVPRMWQQITGGTDAFADFVSWHAGAATQSEARDRCRDAALTGGDLTLTQYLHRGFDANVRCP